MYIARFAQYRATSATPLSMVQGNGTAPLGRQPQKALLNTGRGKSVEPFVLKGEAS